MLKVCESEIEDEVEVNLLCEKIRHEKTKIPSCERHMGRVNGYSLTGVSQKRLRECKN